MPLTLHRKVALGGNLWSRSAPKIRHIRINYYLHKYAKTINLPVLQRQSRLLLVQAVSNSAVCRSILNRKGSTLQQPTDRKF